MAVEVDGQAYHFGPEFAPPAGIVELLCNRFPLLEGDDAPGDDIDASSTAPAPVMGSLISFFYNPLHDLESLWWLTNYFTFEFSAKLSEKAGHHKDAKGEVQGAELRRLSAALFEDNHTRYRVMTITGQFSEYAYLLPRHLRPAGAALEQFRRELVAHYRKSEDTHEATAKPTFDGLHEILAESIRTISKVFARTQQERKTNSTSKKRARDAERRDSKQTISDDTKRPRVL